MVRFDGKNGIDENDNIVAFSCIFGGLLNYLPFFCLKLIQTIALPKLPLKSASKDW